MLTKAIRHSSVAKNFYGISTQLRMKGDERRNSPFHAFSLHNEHIDPKREETYARWEDDPRFQSHKKMSNQGTIGMQSRINFKKNNKNNLTLWVSPKEDPVSFVANMLLIFVFLYTIANLSKGESHPARRRRVIREKLLKEYGLTEADLDEIEGMDSDLSDDLSDELKEEQREDALVAKKNVNKNVQIEE